MANYGMDMGNGGPTCAQWGSAFGTSNPFLDGDADGQSMWSLLALNNYVPRHVVFDHNMELIYSDNYAPSETFIQNALSNVPVDYDEDGVNDPIDNCYSTYNPQQEDIDSDGLGDACDLCDNENIWFIGNTNGSITTNGNNHIDIFDVLSLVEIILENEQESCGFEAANINGDANVNIIDVITLVQLILGGNANSTGDLSEGTFEIYHYEDHDDVVLSSPEKISGFQFESKSYEISTDDLANLSLPDGWVMNYASFDDNIKVIIYDGSGQNPKSELNLNFSDISINSFENTVFSTPLADEIRMRFTESNVKNHDLIPNIAKIQKLYPNPFNPQLSIDFSLPQESMTKISVYNTLGEEVHVVEKGRLIGAGFHSFYWDASDQSSGMYLIKVQTENHIDTQKALLVK